MRIAVANLTSGGLSGGYRKYLARLMPLIAADPRVEQLAVFVPHASALPLPGVDVRPYDPVRGFSALARDVASLRPDVVFIPTARWANFGKVPVVTMVRNMEPLTAAFGANPWGERIRNLARRWEARRAATKARRVIAVSQDVREFIVGQWGIEPRRIGVVYHGVDPSPRSAPLSPKVVFTAGSIRPARGLEDLVRAVPLLGPDVSFVVAGRVDPGAEKYATHLRQMLDRTGTSRQLTWAGQLDESQMSAAFLDATVFVTTSRAEACPNTVLEAMGAGRASVSVDGPPMPEFYGEAAMYYRAGDARQLASQVGRVLADAGTRGRLEHAASERAAVFTWEATRDRTIAELGGALS